ncbi:PDZ/DHR/GLGF domain protein [Ancylostoma ceylanicum]|uniref:PDZ/DHR/GLGF domain protein n=1 Tax=Ancylostoma ceylanicum TaxID=53326 RepID=A0A0D6LZ51_9BILA|nr:PDZ/DHR/GLGF domain protein [Ancylostoma ceylanicum]
MSKSVSIPIALSELKRCSLKRLSSHRERRDTTLNGFVISVADVANGVRVYGTAAERAGLTVGDEILAVNDVEIEGKSHEEVVKYIQESEQPSKPLGIIKLKEFIRQQKEDQRS